MAEGTHQTTSKVTHPAPGSVPPPLDFGAPTSSPGNCGSISDDSIRSLDSCSDGEKDAVIGQILDLQNTLHDLSQRVNTVKEENSKLKAENQVLNQYIENLMVTSGIFKSTSRK